MPAVTSDLRQLTEVEGDPTGSISQTADYPLECSSCKHLDGGPFKSDKSLKLDFLILNS